MSVDSQAHWRIRDDVAWTGEGDRFVALALSDETCTPRALQGSAALVWEALGAGGGTTEDVVDRVAEAAGVDAAVVRADVSAFLSSLADAALVTVTGRSSD